MSVLIYIENHDGQFKKSVLELISYGKEMAKLMNADLNAVLIGQVSDSELTPLGKYGINKIFRVSNPELNFFVSEAYTFVLNKIAKDTSASVILFSNNESGRAMAPRLAVKLNAAFAPGVTKLPGSISPFIVQKKVYSGKAFADYELNAEIKILSLNSNSFHIIENQSEIAIEDINIEITVYRAVCRV